MFKINKQKSIINKDKILENDNSIKTKAIIYSFLFILGSVLISVISITIISHKIDDLNEIKNSSRKDNKVISSEYKLEDIKTKEEKDTSYFQSINKYLKISESSMKKIYEESQKESDNMNENNNITQENTELISDNETTNESNYKTLDNETNKNKDSNEEKKENINEDPNKKDAVYIKDETISDTSKDGVTKNEVKNNTSKDEVTNNTSKEDKEDKITEPTKTKGKSLMSYIKKLNKAASKLSSYGRQDEIDILGNEYKTFRLALKNNKIDAKKVKVYSLNEDQFEDYRDDNFDLSDFAVIETTSSAIQIVYLGDKNEGYKENNVHFYNKDIYYNKNSNK